MQWMDTFFFKRKKKVFYISYHFLILLNIGTRGTNFTQMEFWS